ncbi:MAG: methionine--tRNA ligase subunit beta, partial [Candidatus Sabulitectum sp.]|nr:methionine--tRNA ligase subunit beta [Candidatus Sabulitectum sp.]
KAGKGTEEWKKYWQDPDTRLVQFIGKDNIVFHCIIEPSLLHGLGDFILPWNVPANEYLNISGQKFSTSRSTGIGMGEYLDHFDPDPMRYALAVNAPESRDSDFTWLEYQSRNNELADVLGNFINRTLKFTASKFGNRVPAADLDMTLINKAGKAAENIAVLMESFKFKKAIVAAMELAREGNRYFDSAKPWKSLKTDPEQCAVTVASCLNLCASLAVIFEPFIPFSTEKIRRMLGLGELKWSDAGTVLLKPGHKLEEAEILFKKLEDGFEKIMDRTENISEEEKVEETPEVDFEDFMKIEFKVGRILTVEDIKKAKKLYKIEVDTGDKVRTVVAGMKPHYTKEELQGRLVAVVCNLKPAKLCGVISHGMLMASDGESGVFLIEPGADAKPGDTIR